MFELNKNLEDEFKPLIKQTLENVFNEVMLAEREQFMTIFGTRANGFNDRTLKLSFDLVLNLKVPRVREGSKNLNYSIFKKYQRTTHTFETKLSKFYSGRLFEKEVCKLINMSVITQTRKNKIQEEILEKYREFMNKKKKYDVIKLDATTFSKRAEKNKYTAYFIYGLKKEEGKIRKKCLYYHVDHGSENKIGWKTVINYIKSNIYGVKLIISDLDNTLKKLLQVELPNIDKQNCLWHRLDSICTRIKNLNKVERNDIFFKAYSRIKYAKKKEKIRKILTDFFKYDVYVIKLKTGRSIKKNMKKMLSFYFKENYSYLNHKELIKKYGKKDLYQNMDVESFNSQVKNYLKRHTNYKSREILTFRIFTFLEKTNLL